VEQLTALGARTRIQIEYIEMPDLKLTIPQLRRLCALPVDVCEAAVAELVRSGFLWRTAEGMFLVGASAIRRTPSSARAG
jgi:hypothetical protein